LKEGKICTKNCKEDHVLLTCIHFHILQCQHRNEFIMQIKGMKNALNYSLILDADSSILRLRLYLYHYHCLCLVSNKRLTFSVIIELLIQQMMFL
jgi:hypothetical protein